jgi:3'(2'), 5'-bisphosphate nucleotidase
MTTEREVGLAAVQSAARLCEHVRRAMVNNGDQKIDKEDRSPVTIADFGAQALVCRMIRSAFPGDRIVGEEDSAMLRLPEHSKQLDAVVRFVREQLSEADSESVLRWIDEGHGEPAGRYWVLDPIDGTKGFLRQDQYAIALALIEQGEVQWGFLACPVLPYGTSMGVILVAHRSHGTLAYTLEGDEIGRVLASDIVDLADARLAESVESAHTNRGLSAQLQHALGIKQEPVRMDSQAKYAAIARGMADIYLRSPNPRTPDYRENIWDHAAGWLVVAEAGGRVTDVYGRPLDWNHGRRLEQNIGVVATNGRLHDAVIAELSSLLPPRPESVLAPETVPG